ncbi:deoxyuridine 5'-triphosphate nucleotidohydrolase (plasmid) [Clostridium botulinum]|uniref:dUTP diphosphatase n=1 Tax=Clostridium botulinum C/D str. DC5 TaxID=1443128 RepID=A0A0A0I1C4_CLOBO|nr:deoxyuridine 5'-triphosphate nucleotidohydrolase [Clostridium botulinum]KGM93450.1 deoxyuridine 5'-triphosphate nucleotidohydrolase [Clostridium botulinum C/D str. DC5]KOC56843.1 deoxyuridine 5'-triphosphate nucleotidohydrolase [Clostridium botulinum]KOC57318.1 deoxyuridine 5'-triphosphate nucleotidohydrolase [Clostridium botulinum]MCD3232542.1 deoxyuridine 5'-triphosphate nucleotidohydrolase [Clostridium botulinum D/C]MCD3238529.1 deoxyuridine 5'-triphosphate nucleotidohydrolase [Clostridi
MEKKILFLADVNIEGVGMFYKNHTYNINYIDSFLSGKGWVIDYTENRIDNKDELLHTLITTKFIKDNVMQQLLENNIATINEVGVNELYFAKTKPNAIIPTKREEDAGYDIYTCETETIVIKPCSLRMMNTGIAIACNKAYFPKFFDKGGMGSKGIIVGAGVGDSGYRDSYFVPLINTNKDKTVVITNQSDKEIENCTHFDLQQNKFITLDFNRDVEASHYVKKENCIIKPITKAIVQFVMLPVPTFNTKELSWDELKNIKSERGLGKLGSSGK